MQGKATQAKFLSVDALTTHLQFKKMPVCKYVCLICYIQVNYICFTIILLLMFFTGSKNTFVEEGVS